MRNVTYRIVRFHLSGDRARYVGIAWNYDEAILFSTRDYTSYTNAREALDQCSNERNCTLAYFDDVYERFPGDDAMYPLNESEYKGNNTCN